MDSESTESPAPGDGVKDILAPSEGPRENLINTAIKFLQNPKVMSSPLYQKRAFLEKKGLTQEEIDLAVQRAGVTETTQGATSGQTGPVQVYGPPGAPGVAQPLYAPIPPQSGWARARDLTMTTVVVASVSYAVYQLFQVYIRPLLLGKSAQERRMERLEQEVKAVQESVHDSLGQISRTLAAIQLSLTEQQQQTMSSQGDLRGITDLKADVASLKGLMLSKNQFPALPSSAPVLPSWQRASATSSSTSTSTAATAPLEARPVGTNTAGNETVLGKTQQQEEEEDKQQEGLVEETAPHLPVSSASYTVEAGLTNGENQMETPSELSPLAAS